MVTAGQDKAYRRLGVDWQASWQRALDLWSPYIKLKAPLFCCTPQEEQTQALVDTFAMIRLLDLAVVISLRLIRQHGLQDYALEVLAHEIGHHVYCPANLTDSARLNARIRRGLPTREQYAPMIANLYSDLLINDRLFRMHHLRMDQVYRAVKTATRDPLWNCYMRTYEMLWSLRRGSLTTIPITDEMEGDAHWINRLVRHYADDWLPGAGRFAAICLTYLLRSQDALDGRMVLWLDTREPGDGATIPAGLVEIEADEISGALHPDLEGDAQPEEAVGGETGNHREPFEYGEILRSIGITLDPREIAMRYYKERAVPHLVPFPERRVPQAQEPLPEGLDLWDTGSPLEQIDWFESATRMPVIIPGVTALKRQYGTTAGTQTATQPVDLDIYIDCSGSMPDPAVQISYPALAGTIICLSALRTGSRVQATLWSGKKRFKQTAGFVRNEKEILAILTGYLGGNTAFPIHILRDTYAQRDARSRDVHILVISDEGVDTLLNKDERGNPGADVARTALEKARGGGTMVLNLWTAWQKNPALKKIAALGFELYRIREWSDLMAFSRAFTQKNYRAKDKNGNHRTSFPDSDRTVR